MMQPPVPGTCRYCGCHGDSCATPDGDKCVWLNHTRTVCTAYACQRLYFHQFLRPRKRKRGRAA